MVSTTVDLTSVGTIELPAGFSERRTGTMDSRRGELRRGGGDLVITYDIGAMAGLHMHPAQAPSCVWFKNHLMGDRRVYAGLEAKTGKKILTVSVVSSDGAHDPFKYPANFTATVQSEEDMADVLLIALSYRPLR